MGVKKYVGEVVKEGKRVRWPKWKELLPAIGVVLLIAAFSAVFLMLEDLAAATLLQQLKDAFGSIFN